MIFSAPTEYNSLGRSTALRPDATRSPDTRSDPGAPTDQSLAPPAMPTRVDSRPDFIRGFGLDVPEETDEELEQEQELEQAEEIEQDSLEGLEEEEGRALAEASHIALPGSDDTMDMDLDVDEADAEVGSITTAAQSRIHSRHVSRLSATLSLLSAGGHVDDAELKAVLNEQGEKEGDFEDDAVGEWTDSEDLRTTTEMTEDEVRKFFLPRCFHASPHFVLTIILILTFSLSPSLASFVLLLSPAFSISLTGTFASRRALASGQTHPTRNALAEYANNAVFCVVPTFSSSKNRARSLAVSRTFPTPLRTHFLLPIYCLNLASTRRKT
jgi:hypothetical protein